MAERYYVMEKFAEQHRSLTAICEAMPAKRRAMETYRTNNQMVRAKETYSELEACKKKLLETIRNLRLLFSESDMQDNAIFCGKLYTAVKQFQLLTLDYRKLTAAIKSVQDRIPQNETTNAAVIGRLMNHVKMGYFPTDVVWH